MTSKVDICNLALSNIRSGSINSLTEGSMQAQQCSLRYPIIRDTLLAMPYWQFARRLDVLAVLTDDVFNWAYVYQYPADCLRINRLILDVEEFTQTDSTYRPRHIEDVYSTDLTRQVKYEVANVAGNRVILSNDVNLRIDYQISVDDPNLYSAGFITAFSWYFAAELAEPVIGGDKSAGLRRDALSFYKTHMDEIAVASANEQYSEPIESDFITTRG